ncbi:MAG: ShlB/FhaC/HecB family hemolysin secretion/activation protein [Candidatus Omnitrophota bacterium]
MKKAPAILLGLVFIFAFGFVYAADEAGTISTSQRKIDKEIRLQEKFDKPSPKAEIEEEPQAAQPRLPESTEKVMVTSITVTGATLITEDEINAVTAEFKNKELMLKDMQKMVDMITDIYRRKGFVTSRAYLPPQKIESGNLEVKVLEGITGDVEIKGNRFFKSSLYQRKIALKKGQPFNYEKLREGLSLINEQADRNAKAVIAPGKDPGTTDVLVEVKDRLPIHLGLAWDNFGSRYINYNRFKTTLTHNNLLGFDDSLEVNYQGSEGENYVLLSGRYILPVTRDLNIGFVAANSRIKLQKEFEDLNVRGKSRIYGVYAQQILVNNENSNLVLNLGFDYKDVFNFQAGEETSRDRLRISRIGFDWDVTTRLSRTLLMAEFDYGIPDIMAGLKKRDTRASRDGAGGEFTKEIINLLHRQKLPFDSSIYWKNQIQLTPNILTSTEQFQIGSIVNVRGYPAAEAVGDNGYSMTWEWSIPPYFVPKSIGFPLSKAKIYDAVRIVTFYDWANVRLRRPQAGEQKNKTLRGAGCGLRINLPEDFSARVEFAWPLDQKPSDGKGVQTWAEVSKTF